MTLCSHKDCQNKSRASKKCNRHHFGTCVVPLCLNIAVNTDKQCNRHHFGKCTTDKCYRLAVTQGSCKSHFYGNCSFDGCTKTPVRQGKCGDHGKKCQHKKYIYSCVECFPRGFCDECKYVTLSTNRIKLGITKCKGCDDKISHICRLETFWLEKFKSWGYFPSVHDKTIASRICTRQTMRRPDFLFILGKERKFDLLVECDENSHGSILPSCEMTRLQDIHSALFSNHQCATRFLYVIRFNPNAKNTQQLEKELHTTITQVVHNGNVSLNDDRGIILHPNLLGYSLKRKQEYDNAPITKSIKI